jgi:hypothetical protein
MRIIASAGFVLIVIVRVFAHPPASIPTTSSPANTRVMGENDRGEGIADVS